MQVAQEYATEVLAKNYLNSLGLYFLLTCLSHNLFPMQDISASKDECFRLLQNDNETLFVVSRWVSDNGNIAAP